MRLHRAPRRDPPAAPVGWRVLRGALGSAGQRRARGRLKRCGPQRFAPWALWPGPRILLPRGFSRSRRSVRRSCPLPGQGLPGSSLKGGNTWLVPAARPCACERGSSSRLLPLPPAPAGRERPFLDCSACQGESGPRAPAALLPSTQTHTLSPFSHGRPPFRLPFLLFCLGFPGSFPPPAAATRSQLGSRRGGRGAAWQRPYSPRRPTPGCTSRAGSGGGRWSERGHS